MATEIPATGPDNILFASTSTRWRSSGVSVCASAIAHQASRMMVTAARFMIDFAFCAKGSPTLNAALQRRAHATPNKGYSPASPLQARVRPVCSFPRHGPPQSFVPRDVVTFLVPGARTKDAQAVTRWQEINLDIWANLEVIVTKVVDQVSTSENLPSPRHAEQPIC